MQKQLEEKTMRLTVSRLALVAIVPFVIIMAACGGDDEDGDPTAGATSAATTAATASAATTEAPTAAATAAATSGAQTPSGTAPAGGGATVNAGSAGLVDSEGFSLYTFNNDTAGSGASTCVGGCASAWPPLTSDGPPTAGPGVDGELGVITRGDGTTQVTYKGLPLYRWSGDEAPGDTTGAAITNWQLAQP